MLRAAAGLRFPPFDKGDRASGWLVFDVPAWHGQLVLRNLDEHEVGVWTY